MAVSAEAWDRLFNSPVLLCVRRLLAFSHFSFFCSHGKIEASKTITMSQIDYYIPALKKTVKVSELPSSWLDKNWVANFTNPDQLVVVTIQKSNSTPVIVGQQKIERKAVDSINLAAPDKQQRQVLQTMPLSAQTMIYQDAIRSAAAQPGRKYSRQDIQDLVLNSLTNG